MASIVALSLACRAEFDPSSIQFCLNTSVLSEPINRMLRKYGSPLHSDYLVSFGSRLEAWDLGPWQTCRRITPSRVGRITTM